MINFKMIFPFDVQSEILKNLYLISIDINSEFNNITVHHSLQPYLAFQADDWSNICIGMPFKHRFTQQIFTKTFQMAQAAIKKGVSSTILQYSYDILIINEKSKL